MPELKLPKHAEWKKLKKDYGVADGAVKSVNVGKELDKYYAGTGTTLADQKKLLEPLGAKLNEYITKLDKKKVKKYDPFQKIFLDKYLAPVHMALEDIKRYKPNQELYTKELVKFFSVTQKLDPLVTTKDDLDKYRSGMVRGLAAMGSQVRGVDTSKIDTIVKNISDTINTMPKDISRRGIADFIETTIEDAEEIEKLAKKLGLFA
jgi:hypothetical protein